MKAPATAVISLLQDNDSQVLQAALMALAQMPGKISAEPLLHLLSSDNLMVKGAAAIALAQHQPDVATTILPKQLRQVREALKVISDDYVRRGKPMLTDTEVQPIKAAYRCELQLVQAISIVKGSVATQALEEHAFRSEKIFRWIVPICPPSSCGTELGPHLCQL